jgi:hypothetical protein
MALVIVKLVAQPVMHLGRRKVAGTILEATRHRRHDMKLLATAAIMALCMAGCASVRTTSPSGEGSALPRSAAICPDPLLGLEYPAPSPSAGDTDPVRNPWTVGRDWPQNAEWQQAAEADGINDPCRARGFTRAR